MATKLLSGLFFLLLLVSEGWASYDVKVSDVFFDGGFLFFSVKRAKLQQRLDEINSQFGDNSKCILEYFTTSIRNCFCYKSSIQLLSFYHIWYLYCCGVNFRYPFDSFREIIYYDIPRTFLYFWIHPYSFHE